MGANWRFLISRVLGALLMFSTAASFAAGLSIYPVAAVFFDVPSESSGNRLISPEWEAVYRENGPAMRKAVVDGLAANFGNQVVANIGKEERYKTLLASVSVVRAQHYWVDKPNGNRDVYVPVTGSIYFTNPLTGEVTLTVSTTAKQVQTLATSDPQLKQKIAKLYVDSFSQLLEELLTKAKGAYAPVEILAEVLDMPLGFARLSAGSAQGLVAGDQIFAADGSSMVKLARCEAATCLGQKIFGEVVAGKKFVKNASGKLASLGKPRAFVHVRAPEAGMASIFSQLFAENLGEAPPFNVIFVNPQFQNVLDTAARSNAALSTRDVLAREPPDLVVEVVLDNAQASFLATNLGYKRNGLFTGSASATVVDATGNVVFGTSAVDAVNDEIIDGMDFSPIARADISNKNTLLELADRVAKKYKTAPLVLPLTVTDSGAAVDDKGNQIRLGSSVRIYRELGKGNGRFLVPIRSMRIAKSGDSARTLTEIISLSPEKVEIHTGDLLVVDNAVGKPVKSSATIEICGPGESRGAVTVENTALKVWSAVSSAVELRLVDRESAISIETFRSGDSGFKKVGSASMSYEDAVAADFCLNVIQRVEPQADSCTEQGVCQIPISAKFAVQLVQDGKPIVQKIVEQKFTTMGFFGALDEAGRSSLVSATVMRNIEGSIDALMKLAKVPLETAATGP